jgi:tetratricopeptide (TPR) repeat protein
MTGPPVRTFWVICLLAPFAASATDSAPIEEVVVTALRHDAQICADFTQPPAPRVAACTRALQEPVMGTNELPGFMERYRHALLGQAEMVRDGAGNALPGKTYRGMLLDLRANALTILGQRDAAIADYTEALDINRWDLVAFASRANLRLDVDPHRLIFAASNFDERLRKDWANGTDLYNQGVESESHGERNRAIDDYRQAVGLLPSFARAHSDLGRLLKDQDPDLARVELGEAIQLDPWIPGAPAFKARAALNLSRGQLEAALADINQIIARDATDAVAYLNRGFIKEQQGCVPAGLDDYTRSIQIAPSASSYFDRAIV